MATWQTVIKLGRALPGVEEGTWFRTPCLKVRGKSFTRLKEDGESIVVMVSEVEKELLLAARPDVFFQTDHYVGYPAMLVRLGTVTEAQLRERLQAAWQLKAPRSLLKELGLTSSPAAAPARKQATPRRRATARTS